MFNVEEKTEYVFNRVSYPTLEEAEWVEALNSWDIEVWKVSLQEQLKPGLFGDTCFIPKLFIPSNDIFVDVRSKLKPSETEEEEKWYEEFAKKYRLIVLYGSPWRNGISCSKYSIEKIVDEFSYSLVNSLYDGEDIEFRKNNSKVIRVEYRVLSVTPKDLLDKVYDFGKPRLINASCKA